MDHKELMHCAAIITAGMIARQHDKVISPEMAAKMFDDVAAAIQARQNSGTKIDEGYGM